MRFLFVVFLVLTPRLVQGQNQMEWSWNRMHIAIDSGVKSDLSARSSEIIQEFHQALTEAENTLGYKASGALHFQAFNDLNEYELALKEHSAYRHLQGLSIVDANDGIFPLYLHSTRQEMQQQLRWGIAYGLLREYLFGITVKQRFDQAKLTRLPAWVIYGFCRYFAMGWSASDKDEWQFFYDNRAFRNSNHLLAQSQDVYGQFVWKELERTLGTGTLSSFWFVIKYTGQVDAAFQYHLGLDFHEWMADHMINGPKDEPSSSLFQSDLDWGSSLMGHPLIEMVLDSSAHRGVGTFFWPGKQVLAYSDFEHNHRWIRMRDQVALCQSLSFTRTLIWNHENGQGWESLWKENGKWIWSRWSNRGELQQKEEWDFDGHPLQVFHLQSKLYITEQIGSSQRASPFGYNPLPSYMGSWIELQSLNKPGGSDVNYFSFSQLDTTTSRLFSTKHQRMITGLLPYRIHSIVGEAPALWSVMVSHKDDYHWIFVRDSNAVFSALGEWPIDGYFPTIGYTGNPQQRYVADYLDGQTRIRLYSIKSEPDSLRPLSILESKTPGSLSPKTGITSQSPLAAVQFLGPFPKPNKPRTPLEKPAPAFPEFDIHQRLRWYYIKHASVKLSNRRSSLLVPVELPMSSLFNSVFTPDFYTQIGSSDLRHRMEIAALISPDFKRNALTLSQEYDLENDWSIGQDLQMLRRRVLVLDQNIHWQSWNTDVYARRNWNDRSEFSAGVSFEHAYLGNLFTSDQSLNESSRTQSITSLHLDWNRNCSDLPFFRAMDHAHYRASVMAARSPGFTGMNSADFQLNMQKQSGRQLKWNSTLSLHYAPGKDAIIHWIGGSEGWTSQQVWLNPYSGIFDNRSAWQRMGPGIRGFQSGSRLGSSYAVFNQTLSSPILQYLHKGLMHSEFSKSLILFVFNDVGTAFFGPSPQAEGNPFNTQYFNTPNYNLSVTSKRNPYLGAVGMGVQAKLLGYHWRLERAWGYQERKVQSPMWHLSMGKSIDWD